MGRIDVLVNNAGDLVERKPLLEMSEALWRQVLDLNLSSVLFVTQAAAPAASKMRVGGEKLAHDPRFATIAERRKNQTGNNNQIIQVRELYVSTERPRPALPHPETNRPLPPKAPGGPAIPITPGEDPRLALFEWMRSPDNPFFARSFVNRVWAHYFGVGLVDQGDGCGDDNFTYPALLADLASEFVAHKYDVKFLIRAITASETYQRASAFSHDSQKNPRLFARMPLRGMSPEQLFDSLAVATEYKEPGGGADPRVAFMEAPQLLLQNNTDIAERQFGIRVGEIAVGRPADLAIMDYCPPTPMSEANFLGHLIFGLVDATVDTTVCRGRILMQNKKILSMDEERIAARSRELAPEMWKRLQAM